MFLVALNLSGEKIGVDQRSQENTFLATKKKGCMASGPSENRSLSKTFIDRYHSKDEIKNLWQNPLLCMIMYLRFMFSVIPKKMCKNCTFGSLIGRLEFSSIFGRGGFPNNGSDAQGHCRAFVDTVDCPHHQ